jgi:pimeloyl-ACP methyl ester carboxylesterase
LLIGESRGSFVARGFAHLRPEQVAGMLLIVPGVAPSALRRAIPAERLATFDQLVVQTAEIVEKTKRTKWAATPLHDTDMAARVLEQFDFSFELEDPDAVFDGPCLIVSGR